VELVPLLQVVGLTLTTCFRSLIDITHLLEEYKTIQDHRGGYRAKVKSWQSKPTYYTHILGEIADELYNYMSMLNTEKVTISNVVQEKVTSDSKDSCKYPDSSQLCPVCGEKALIKVEGCNQCLACNYSKCN